MIVAIDGPVGVGKSTVARAVADALGFLHVDTGAMYRALAWRCSEEGLDPKDAQAMTDLAGRTEIGLHLSTGSLQVLCDGVDVSEAIRTPKITALVSDVSAHSGLRKIVVDNQRVMAKGGNVVMEGRDIGTVVFPEAEAKIFMEASVEARALRRKKDFDAKGLDLSLEEIQDSIRTRDAQDRGREHSPLRAAEDAVVLDTTELTFEESVRAIVRIVKEKQNR